MLLATSVSMTDVVGGKLRLALGCCWPMSMSMANIGRRKLSWGGRILDVVA